MQSDLYSLAEHIGETLRNQGIRVTTAESCTGGWVAKAITDAAGSSQWFEAGFVTYSNRAKQSLLGVDGDILEQYGAVSAETVEAMARGALARCEAHLAVAISGVAGPDGGSADKPVGTVWFAWASVVPGKVRLAHEVFQGNRDAVRRAAVATALRGLVESWE
jgi:nicotinamide-nucleotide amidase